MPSLPGTLMLVGDLFMGPVIYYCPAKLDANPGCGDGLCLWNPPAHLAVHLRRIFAGIPALRGLDDGPLGRTGGRRVALQADNGSHSLLALSIIISPCLAG